MRVLNSRGTGLNESCFFFLIVVGKRLSAKPKGKLLSYVKKIVVALGIALLFALLGIFSGLGYLGEADVQEVDRDPSGFWWVHAQCNISYNPFLYSFLWLGGQGYFSGNVVYLSVPTYVGSEFKFPLWRSSAELEEEVILRLVLNNLLVNIPFNFAILVMIELMKIRDLYLCLFGGIVGFPIGGPIGAVAGFFSGVLVVMLVVPRLMSRLRIIFFKEDLERSRTLTPENEER